MARAFLVAKIREFPAMPNNALSIIIDPAGIPGVRPGINLQVFPESDPLSVQPSENTLTRTANGNLETGGYADIQNWNISFRLGYADFHRLLALYHFQEKSRARVQPFETVFYNLFQPYSEFGNIRSRYRVPGTENLVEEVISASPPVRHYVYWIAVQGYFNLSYRQEGVTYICNLNFTEGTRLLRQNETL